MTAEKADQFERHSEIDDLEIIKDPAELALAEARNALRQFDIGMEILDGWIGKNAGRFQIKPSQVLTLNRVVLEGVSRWGGTFRTMPIRITKSTHVPPEPTEVPAQVEDFCEYLNSNFRMKSALHLAAYALWRINWIHPFVDGNGRTARIVAYIILSAKLGYKIPGTRSIPEQIADNKKPYYLALENADEAFRRGAVDVSETEKLLGKHLAAQLLSVHNEASVNLTAPGTESAAPARLSHRFEADVNYNYADGSYRPVWKITIDDTLRTAKEEHPKNWLERNPATVTAISAIVASLLAVIVIWMLTRQ